MIINGIEDLASRADLLDRCITIELPAIPDDCRKTEKEIKARFESLRPQLLGALLMAVSAALANESTVQLDKLPRMADLAEWIIAGEKGLNIPAGEFIRAFRGNIAGANEAALEASPIFEPLKEFLDTTDGATWRGTLSELLRELNIRAGIKNEQGIDLRKPPPGWPINARALRGKLTRIMPNLRRAGIEVSKSVKSTAGRRILTISTVPVKLPLISPDDSTTKGGVL